MIEELSDEKIKEMAWEYYHGERDRRIIKEGMRIGRDFYKTQIDAQAKTMEELYAAWLKSDVCNKADEWAKSRYDVTTTYRVLFREAVGFFLAAGGRIKE